MALDDVAILPGSCFTETVEPPEEDSSGLIIGLATLACVVIMVTFVFVCAKHLSRRVNGGRGSGSQGDLGDETQSDVGLSFFNTLYDPTSHMSSSA